MLNRRQLLVALSGLTVTSLACCASSSVTPAEVAADIAAEATGLSSAIALLPTNLIPAPTLTTIQTSLKDLVSVSNALSGADMPSAAVLSRVQSDVEAVISALNNIVPASIQSYLTAAAVLLPVIMSAAQSIFPSTLSAKPFGKATIMAAALEPTLTSSQARSRLLLLPNR